WKFTCSISIVIFTAEISKCAFSVISVRRRNSKVLRRSNAKSKATCALREKPARNSRGPGGLMRHRTAERRHRSKPQPRKIARLGRFMNHGNDRKSAQNQATAKGQHDQ